MGYTNYWQQPIDFSDNEWKQIKQEVQYVSEIAGNEITGLEYTDDYIVFNGGKGGSCETFYLEKKKNRKPQYVGQDVNFNFCKTREMKYDIYVWHMLVFIAGMINDTNKFSISRDR